MGVFLDAYLKIVWVWMKDGWHYRKVPEEYREHHERKGKCLLRKKLKTGHFKGFRDEHGLIPKKTVRTRSMSGSFDMFRQLPITTDI